MPIPKPSGAETQSEFVSRCMSELSGEYPDKEQRLAICYDVYRQNLSDEKSTNKRSKNQPK